MGDLDKAMNDLDKAVKDLAKVSTDLVERTERLNRRLRTLNEVMGRRNRSERFSRILSSRQARTAPEGRKEDAGILAQVRELLDNS